MKRTPKNWARRTLDGSEGRRGQVIPKVDIARVALADITRRQKRLIDQLPQYIEPSTVRSLGKYMMNVRRRFLVATCLAISACATPEINTASVNAVFDDTDSKNSVVGFAQIELRAY